MQACGDSVRLTTPSNVAVASRQGDLDGESVVDQTGAGALSEFPPGPTTIRAGPDRADLLGVILAFERLVALRTGQPTVCVLLKFVIAKPLSDGFHTSALTAGNQILWGDLSLSDRPHGRPVGRPYGLDREVCMTYKPQAPGWRQSSR